ncbi:class I SAM-dependent methyltransferase [Candidatus Odyssella thessalonicensis]|uniref:class I SAM-dependent methyltransferase n=1 Tax=Candidatus Odyssella thessalonicensis TaxID=84647 RepID=UPI000225ACD1|nr:class I SAM-dependent methyltransferase [Candidatus Odyssella thessalonicensis]
MHNKRVRFFITLFSVLALISEKANASERKEAFDGFLDSFRSSKQMQIRSQLSDSDSESTTEEVSEDSDQWCGNDRLPECFLEDKSLKDATHKLSSFKLEEQSTQGNLGVITAISSQESRILLKAPPAPATISVSDSEYDADAENQVTKRMPKKKYKKRLLLGEADFSFTVALLKKHEIKHPYFPEAITTTELLSENDLKAFYPESFKENMKYLQERGITPLFNVDACRIATDFNQRRFKRIHFNFPHDKSDYRDRTLPPLIGNFFLNASALQIKGDRVHITLPHPHTESREKFYQGYVYGIYDASYKAGYDLIKKRTFNNKRYPGYKHCITKKNESAKIAEEGREYIFEKKREAEIHLTPPPSGRETTYKNVSYNALPELKTDEDSSDYFSETEDISE